VITGAERSLITITFPCFSRKASYWPFFSSRYSSHEGYAETFAWASDYVDATPRDHFLRRETQIFAIDALNFAKPWFDFPFDFILHSPLKTLAKSNHLPSSFIGTSFTKWRSRGSLTRPTRGLPRPSRRHPKWPQGCGAAARLEGTQSSRR